MSAPAGARAASAGTFITAAANFAVMAPGTTIGAASPVKSDGGDIPSTLSRKISADTSAFIRSIAQARDRNAEALEDTVLKSTSYSAEEALELGVIDLIAPDMNSHARTAQRSHDDDIDRTSYPLSRGRERARSRQYPA